jgi:single-strand DNA-binding protein
MFQITLQGRLGADPVLRQTPAGHDVVDLRVAVRTAKRTEGKAHTEWVDVTAWGATAKFVVDNFVSAKPIIVVGELREVRVYSRKDGSPGASMAIDARKIHFPLGGSSDDSAASAAEEEDAPPF